MPKNDRSKKKAARRRQRATGAPYTAAAGGGLHEHPAPDFGALDSRMYGVQRQVSLAPAAALVGAARVGCLPCQKSAIPALVAGDRLAVAALAGPMSMLPSPGLMSEAGARVWKANRDVLGQDLGAVAPAAGLLALLEGMSEGEVRDVVEDALDLWAGLGPGGVPEDFAAVVTELVEAMEASEEELPEASEIPSNPFTADGLVHLSPGELAGGVPLPLLLQMALGGTVEDQITEHAHELFAELVDRGPAAGREAALLLTQYVLSTGFYGTGTDAAVRYYRQQPPPMAQAPALTLLHLLVSAYIATGRPGGEQVLGDDVSAAEVDGVVRFLFCMAAGASGWPRERQQALTEELCADVR